MLSTALAQVLAPILSHTMEEVWQHLPEWSGKERTIQLCDWPDVSEWHDGALGERWEGKIVPYFEQADLALEGLRQSGEIRQPLEAELVLSGPEERWELLQEALGGDELAAASGVSRVSYAGPSKSTGPQDEDGLAISGRRLEAPKCERCWRRQESVGTDEGHPELCARCVEYLTA
jgi:isoleucyl-tRNA synthetase